MLTEKLTSGEHQGFIGSIFIDLLNVAEASTKKRWFRKRGIGGREPGITAADRILPLPKLGILP